MSKELNKGLALVIGVGNDLPSTITDAEGVFEVLTTSAGSGYDQENVILLTGESATREGILSSFDHLLSKINQYHSVIIYYSGHGGYTKDDDEYFLVPFDFDAKNLENTWVKSSELTDRLNRIDSKKMFFVLDCCHAAGMTDDYGENTEDRTVFKNLGSLVKKLGGNRNFVLSSCRDGEKSYIRKSDKYSLFTQCLIEALSAENNESDNDAIHLVDVVKYIFKEVPVRSKGKQNPFLNKMEDLDSDFPISRFLSAKSQEFIKLVNDSSQNDEAKEKLNELEIEMDAISKKIKEIKEKRQQDLSFKEKIELDAELIKFFASRFKMIREKRKLENR